MVQCRGTKVMGQTGSYQFKSLNREFVFCIVFAKGTTFTMKGVTVDAFRQLFEWELPSWYHLWTVRHCRPLLSRCCTTYSTANCASTDTPRVLYIMKSDCEWVEDTRLWPKLQRPWKFMTFFMCLPEVKAVETRCDFRKCMYILYSLRSCSSLHLGTLTT